MRGKKKKLRKRAKTVRKEEAEQDFKSKVNSNGFSDDCATKSKLQHQSLKDLISGLEEEEAKMEMMEIVEQQDDVVMRMVEDFNLLSESDEDDDQESTKKVRNHIMLSCQ